MPRRPHSLTRGAGALVRLVALAGAALGGGVALASALPAGATPSAVSTPASTSPAARVVVRRAPRSATVPLGHFAGYLWEGRVTEVSATLTVPRIVPGSATGSIGATWIGAQAPGDDGPFIQIGINEMRTPDAVDGAAYYAFWSDTRLHFHPHFLLTLGPGDTVATSLRRLRDGWQLAIVDVTSGASRRFRTTDEARGAFNLAEWIQEDPTQSDGHTALAYPRTTPARFEHLLVDSRQPAPATLRSQWMSLPRGYLGPGPLAGDAFAVHPMHLGATAARYIALAAPFDAALRRFERTTRGWDVATPRARTATAYATLAAAVRANIRGFSAPGWPPHLRPLIRLVAHHARVLLAALRAGPRLFRHDPDAFWASYVRPLHALSALAGRILPRLHGPELFQ